MLLPKQKKKQTSLKHEIKDSDTGKDPALGSQGWGACSSLPAPPHPLTWAPYNSDSSSVLRQMWSFASKADLGFRAVGWEETPGSRGDGVLEAGPRHWMGGVWASVGWKRVPRWPA